MADDGVVHGVAQGDDEPVEKAGLRNAWGRGQRRLRRHVGGADRSLTRRGLDLLAPEPDWTASTSPAARG